MLVLLEEEGEGRVAERRSIPGEDRPAGLDRGPEHLRPAVAEDAVDPVRGRDQVVLGDDRLGVGLVDLEAQLDPFGGGAPLEDVEQALARDRPKADAAAAQDLAVDPDLDRVPGVGAGQDLLVGRLVVLAQVAHRLFGEDDAEPERVVGPVAFVNRDVVVGIGALGEHREVETGRAASNHSDLHWLRKDRRPGAFDPGPQRRGIPSLA